jgi:phosphatidylglycerol lysyltransferase
MAQTARPQSAEAPAPPLDGMPLDADGPSPVAAASPPRGPLWHALRIAIRVLLLAGVVLLVWRELVSIDIQTARGYLMGAHTATIFAAMGAVLFAVAAMGLYDVFSFPDTPRLTRSSRWGLGMLMFAWTNFLTLGPIGGPAVRVYLYRRRGMASGQILRGLARMYAGMFGGLSGWLIAALAPVGTGLDALAAQVAIALLLAPALAVLAGQVIQRVRPIGRVRAQFRMYGALGLVGALDWGACFATFALAGRALHTDLFLADQIRIVFAGHAVGIVSMMPGGLGSADAVWLKLLSAEGLDGSTAAAQIVLFRMLFYVSPFLVSLLGLYVVFAGRTEVRMRWQRRVLAGAIGMNAAWLLASTATPAVTNRLPQIHRLVPVGAIEASHAVAVIAAVMMLFLIRGVLRGYRSAFVITGSLLAASAIAHPFKGGDVEEALVSLAMLVLLVGARPAFKRRGRIPIGWELTLGAALGSLAFFLLVGIAAFSELRYGPELWTRVALLADESRFLRGAVLVAFVGLVFLVREAVLPHRRREFASDSDIDRAARFITTHAEHAAALNIVSGDKAVWFWHPDGEARPEQGLVVYQRRHSKLVVFADPVVGERRMDELLEDFHAFAADQDTEIVFYQITGRCMEHLHDYGYTFFKLGEEAVVPLAEFSLAGGHAHQYRKTIRRVEGEGVTFQVLFPPFALEVIDEARQVSDEWLAHKGIQEMQFSLGHFSPRYLQRFPIAVARDSTGRMVAFMNILAVRPVRETFRGRAEGAPAPAWGELSFDLMRYRPGIDSLMDFMVLHALQWGHQQGYASVNLGMSPLFDVGEYKRASLPERLARLLFEHGERIYNYRGLHAFKEKFRPIWEPRFMAYQRPWDWPAAVLTTTALIWGKSPEERRRIEAARVLHTANGDVPARLAATAGSP